MKTVKKKYNLFKRYLVSKSGTDYIKYIKVRNNCNKVIKNARRQYEQDIARDGKLNPKKFWRYVQERTKVNVGVGTLKCEDGSLVTDDSRKAEVLNNFFSSVFTCEDLNNLPSLDDSVWSEGVTLADIRITPEAVEKKLRELDPNKSQGPDMIPAKVLKELSRELSFPLSFLFNLSLEMGILPNDWKSAEVVALFKKGSRLDPGNYRPVSLTCIICKVLESIIRDSIVSHLIENKLLSDCQHGFRKKRSCVTQLLEVMNDLTCSMDNGYDIDILYLDFKKAFDSVPHERLIIKLKAYGITGQVLRWISAFLLNRTQQVRVGTATSGVGMVLSGIPQGSILGPILFLIFINDLPHCLKSTCKIFADDTKIYNISPNTTDIQSDLNKLLDWSETWQLQFNISKCKVLHIGRRVCGGEFSINVNNDVIGITSCNAEKDLGVMFDTSLSFDAHIHNVVNRANQMLGIIKRCFSFLNRDIFLKLYKAFVRPHLEYANVIWNPYLKRQSIMIERVQRRATKLLFECRNMSYRERLQYLNLHSLKGRRLRGDLIQTFKIFNQIDDLDMKNFFALSETTYTRNSEAKIFIKYSKTNKRKKFFSNRVSPHWNSLPTYLNLHLTLLVLKATWTVIQNT